MANIPSHARQRLFSELWVLPKITMYIGSYIQYKFTYSLFLTNHGKALGTVLVHVVYQTLFAVPFVPLKHFFVVNKAVQYRHDAYIEYIHKHVTDPVGNQKDDTHGTTHRIQVGANIFHNNVVTKDGHDGTNKEFAHNQNGSRDVTNGRHASGVAEDQGKRFATGFAKGG